MQAPVAVRCFTNCYTLPLPLPLCYVPKAQLSQLGCATDSVIENFAKLLEAMRKYAVEYGMCKFLLVFYNWYDAER